MKRILAGWVLGATLTVIPVARGGYPEAPVNLGTAGDFVVLAETGISAGSGSGIVGDIGVSPYAATFMTGFALVMDPLGSGAFSLSAKVDGQVYAADYSPPTPSKMTTAVSDMETAYTEAANRPLPVLNLLGGGIGSLTLVPGLYKWTSGVNIASDLTLAGGPADVWIFQISGTLDLASAKKIILSGGAQSKNIFWQVADAVTIFTGAHFEGIILAKTGITVQTGASVNGRLLAQTRVDFQAGGGITAVPPTADLVLTKTVDDPTPLLNSNVVFTVTVTNAGPDQATGVTVQDVLPAGLDYVTNSIGLYSPSNGVWNIGTLNAGSSATLQITATVTNTGEVITNIAQVATADQFDPNSTPGNSNPNEDDQAYALVNVGGSANLSLTKTVDNSAPTLGTNVVFTIKVTNNGPSIATGVTVLDLLPGGLVYVTNSIGDYTAGTGIWDIGALTVGSVTTLTITATVTLSGTTLVNTAQVWTVDQVDPNSAPGNNKPNEDDQASVGVFALGIADLALTKVANITTPAFGSDVTFTITVTNAGPSVATGVTVKDLLPAGLVYVTHGAGIYTASSGIWNVGTLNVGASRSLTITATVTNTSGIIVNMAQVWMAAQADPNSTPANSNPAEDDQASVSLTLSGLTLMIVSAHGTGTPPVGMYTNAYGTALTNYITGTNSLIGTETLGGTQFVNVGWSMLGNEPVAGSINGMTMVHTNDAVLTWLWSTNYYLSLTAVNGTITNATPGWKPANGSYSPTPTPDLGYIFDRWEVNGVSQGSGVPLSVTMDEAKGVVAVFKPIVIDGRTQVDMTATWVFDPRKGCFLGSVTISNTNALQALVAPFWFEVASTEWHWLRYPTGRDSNTGMDYVDISAAVGQLNPGASVTVTGIELMGRRSPEGLVMAGWSDTLTPNGFGYRMVGMDFEMSQPDAFDGAANVRVRGLRQGLRYDRATQMITGVPTRPGTFKIVISAKDVPTQTVIFEIEALPTWAQGTFNGTVEGGGLATMTVSARGKVTGKLALDGMIYTFRAASYTAGGNVQDGFLIVADAKARGTVLPVTLRVTKAVAPAPHMLGVAVGQLGDGVELVLYRDVWKEAGAAALTSLSGYYTATLPGNEEHGSGYLTLTVNKNGKTKVSGRMADGIAVSSSGMLTLDEQGRVWAVVYMTPRAYKGGGFAGRVEFVLRADAAIFLRALDETPFLWQNRSPNATSEYGEGFSRGLQLSGGWFDKIGNLYDYYAGEQTLTVVTDAAAPTPELWSGNTSYESVCWDPDGIVLTGVNNRSGALSGLSAPKAGSPTKVDDVWIYDEQNAVGLKVRLTRATGLFSGSFKMWADTETQHLSQTAKLVGVLTPECEDKADGIAGRGYFLSTDKANYLNSQGKSLPYSFVESYDLKLMLSEPIL